MAASAAMFSRQIEKSRLVSGFRIWDNGFRQITSGYARYQDT